jgi:hypothetical protein
MADLKVNGEFLAGTIEAVAEALKYLEEVHSELPRIAPRGFALTKTESMIDGVHSLIDLSAKIYAHFKMIKYESKAKDMTSKTKRKGGKYRLL